MGLAYFSVASALISFLVIIVAANRFRRHSIAHLPGPPARSRLVGNKPEIFRPESVGDQEFSWVTTFGNSLRMKGTFGNDVLYSVDPKAFHHILNTAWRNFSKTPEYRIAVRFVAGQGLIWAEGAQHSRQRKIMEPAFSHNTLKTYLPVFRQAAQKTVGKWQSIISRDTSVIDVSSWMSRLTLDIIGITAFDYQFDALDKSTVNEFGNAYHNLLFDAYHNRSNFMMLLEEIMGYLPEWLLSTLQTIPHKQVARLKNFTNVARRVAQSLLKQRMELHAAGQEGGKDLMSLFIRANLSEMPQGKLHDEEIIAQLIIMVAGHETTATTISWALYELSLHKEFQGRVRSEIKAARAQAAKRGDIELGVEDLKSMKHLDALLKETLRIHPILASLSLVASSEEVIPLSTPQKTKSGEMTSSIPISKGQKIHLSIAGYNRLTSIWGEDANVWRPERFLEGTKNSQKAHLGVYANLASFSSGTRSCIGWRFAVMQMQAILTELIENFEFSLAPGNVEIIRAPIFAMSPVVKGSETDGVALPLIITSIN